MAYHLTGYSALAGTTVSAPAIYFVLHWGFNNYFWRLLPLPNISGSWNVSGKTIDSNGKMVHRWKGILSIEQKWDKIAVHFKTEKSEGYSYIATLIKKDGAETWSLKYSYKNEPKIAFAHKLNAHKGCSEIDFSGDLSQGEGFYYNSNERSTFGTIQLERTKK